MSKTKSKPETAPQEKAGGDCPSASCSPSSLTPESDGAYESFEDATNEVLRHFVDYEVARKLEMERDRLRGAINSALMHLETNYDIDGASMKDSDAARKLRSAISPENA